MKKQTPTAKSSSIPVGISISCIATLLLAGGVFLWVQKTNEEIAAPFPEQPQPRPMNPTDPVTGLPTRMMITRDVASVKELTPNIPVNLSALHSFSYGEENGVKVIRLQVVADGDIMVIDANSGRLIETRPNRPIVKQPNSIHPLAPMTSVQMSMSVSTQ